MLHTPRPSAHLRVPYPINRSPVRARFDALLNSTLFSRGRVLFSILARCMAYCSDEEGNSKHFCVFPFLWRNCGGVVYWPKYDQLERCCVGNFMPQNNLRRTTPNLIASSPTAHTGLPHHCKKTPFVIRLVPCWIPESLPTELCSS